MTASPTTGDAEHSSEQTAEHPRPPAGIGPVVTAMITPFGEDGALDLDGAQQVADHLVVNGTDTVLVNGTTGESPTLHGDEPWQLLRAVRDAVDGRATLLVGTGSNDTAKTVETTGRAASDGADAVLVVAPYYNRPGQAGLLHHFRTAAAATELPVILYDVPSRTSLAIGVDTLVELAGLANVVGVKDATADLGKAADVLHRTVDAPGGFAVWSGADEVNLPLLSLGAVGVVSVSSHLVGPEIAEMIRVYPTDAARARHLHLACMPVHRALFAEPSPSPLKGALAALGVLPSPTLRAPLVPASANAVQAVLEALKPVEAAR